MNILSLFDGMSCGRIALERAGIPVTNYFASEIDKHAIKVSEFNYPDIKRVGDVSKIKISYDELTDETTIFSENGVFKFVGFFDAIIAGSPCQGFSFAGKQLNFSDPRSVLFFEFARLKNECAEANPDLLFLLENVKMKKEYMQVISDVMGVEPIEINSALVSAQNRKRLYWTNIKDIFQPEDKGILLKDILETDGVGVIKNRGELSERNEKSMCLDAPYYKGVDNHGQRTQILAGRIVGRKINPKTGKRDDKNISIKQRIEINDNPNKTGTLTTVEKDNILIYPSTTDNVTTLNPKKPDGSQTYQQDRIYKTDGKMVCLSAELSGRFNISNDGLSYRKLTPIECERLQTVPDNYTAAVSNSQRYKMLGNGWNVDTIVHILNHI